MRYQLINKKHNRFGNEKFCLFIKAGKTHAADGHQSPRNKNTFFSNRQKANSAIRAI